MKREGNPNWKGGRTVTEHGYVLIKVGTDHHLADVRGYAYEHRLVAEKKLGRRLTPGEIAHHDDEQKANNSPENIIPVASLAVHRAMHRKPGSNLRNPGEANEDALCACGCGGQFKRFDAEGRPRKFISGHNHQRNKKGQFHG
jgi:hypothetical protein